MLDQRKEMAVFEKRGDAPSADVWLRLGGVGLQSLTCLSSVANHFRLLCWTPREKSSVEEEIKEKEEAIRQRTDEVQVRLPILLCGKYIFKGGAVFRTESADIYLYLVCYNDKLPL